MSNIEYKIAYSLFINYLCPSINWTEPDQEQQSLTSVFKTVGTYLHNKKKKEKKSKVNPKST